MIDIAGLADDKGDTFTYTATYQAFIESNQMINNKMYDVLYGGVQWGFTVRSTAVPEPATLTLLAELVAMATLGYFAKGKAASGSLVRGPAPGPESGGTSGPLRGS